MLYVENYFKKTPDNAIRINTTSKSDDFGRGLSPFLLEGGHLYGDYYAKNVENAWQASKVYSEYMGKDGMPTEEYFKWAVAIWNSTYAYRYPMGKGRIPEYSFWDGEKLDYVSARKKIYIPIYARIVVTSDAFKKLAELYEKEERDIYLMDFDGYNHVKMNKTIEEVINDPNKKMGHAFVIYKLLTELIKKETFKPKKLW